MNDLTRAALDYLAQGHHLLALAGKRPNNRYHAKPSDDEAGWSWDKSIHGAPEHGDHPMDGYVGAYSGCPGCDDVKALDAIFSDPTTTGVAILIPKGVLVADIDTEEAAGLFLDLSQPGDTPTVRTPKGWHLWYDAVGADASVWLGGRTLLFKGFGGYVAAPPSRHFDKDGVEDGVYTWVKQGPRSPLPSKVSAAIRVLRDLDAMKPDREPTGPTLALDLDENGRWLWTGHAEFNIRGLADAVRSAPEGNRNNMLAWAALTAAEEGVGLDYAMQELTDAARDAGLTARETFITIKAAFSRRRRG